MSACTTSCSVDALVFLLPLLSRFRRVRPCATPQTAAHRLLHPWDSPGTNTGVGCHFLLQCMKVESESEVTQPCPTLHDPMDCRPPGSSIHGILQARALEWAAVAFSACVTRTGQSKQNLCRRQVKKPVRLLKTISETCLESYLFENLRAEPKMRENLLGFEETYSSHWH